MGLSLQNGRVAKALRARRRPCSFLFSYEVLAYSGLRSGPENTRELIFVYQPRSASVEKVYSAQPPSSTSVATLVRMFCVMTYGFNCAPVRCRMAHAETLVFFG